LFRPFRKAFSTENGNIFFTDAKGRTVQITSANLDSDPSLSVDGRLVVFVRRTPALRIDTGLGETDENELWITGVSRTEAAHRVLIGHSGGFQINEDLVLAGFAKPLFSLDGHRIYFTTQTWATGSSARVLDLATGRVRFICVGEVVEVIPGGMFAGHVVVHKEVPRVLPGRVWRFWLLDSDGNEVGEIGDRESDLDEFRLEFDASPQ
jgi:hypothetical protein